jgi:hypothetical protein
MPLLHCTRALLTPLCNRCIRMPTILRSSYNTNSIKLFLVSFFLFLCATTFPNTASTQFNKPKIAEFIILIKV